MPAYCRFKADRENDFVVVLPIAFIANLTTFVQPKSAIRACTDFVYCPRHSLYIYTRAREGLKFVLPLEPFSNRDCSISERTLMQSGRTLRPIHKKRLSPISLGGRRQCFVCVLFANESLQKAIPQRIPTSIIEIPY